MKHDNKFLEGFHSGFNRFNFCTILYFDILLISKDLNPGPKILRLLIKLSMFYDEFSHWCEMVHNFWFMILTCTFQSRNCHTTITRKSSIPCQDQIKISSKNPRIRTGSKSIQFYFLTYFQAIANLFLQ
jgi:hypothetical protein